MQFQSDVDNEITLTYWASGSKSYRTPEMRNLGCEDPVGNLTYTGTVQNFWDETTSEGLEKYEVKFDLNK